MPEFATPFQGNVDRKISKEELIQAIRIDIAAELEAMFLYDSHANATDDPIAQEILRDIRDEEKLHLGQLIKLLEHLDPDGTTHFMEGYNEAIETIKASKVKEPVATFPKTIGSLIK